MGDAELNAHAGTAAMGDDIDMVYEGKVAELTGDGGVKKTILTAGEGFTGPETGDEVHVHYVGTLEADGSMFDSSRERGEPFTFTLGMGQVIKGWDVGVASMKKGEKAILTCKSDYAYGASGSPPKIPGGATLNFEVELLSWKSTKDLLGDGGVMKTVLAEGEGWDNPRARDELTVVYSAKLAGVDKAFKESPEGGASFTLADGHLCKGLVVAVEKMKKGEKVSLALKPEYAFGAEGNAELGVPPNADVELELELVNWKKVEDVTDDGLVVKKALELDPDEYKRPNEGSKVTLALVGRLVGGEVFQEGEVSVLTCEEQLCEGLDLAVMKMRSGEKALVTISDAKYAFGAAGRPAVDGLAGVPADAAPITYEVTLKEFANAKEAWEMSDPEKLQAAKAKKEKGNTYFKAGNLKRAVASWDKAVNLISYDKAFAPDLLAETKDIKKGCYGNMAQVALKDQNWEEAIKNADKVLELDPAHVKALFRRASARKGTKDYFEAEQDVKKALELEPEDAGVKALDKQLKALIKEQDRKEAKLYSKMFAKGFGDASSAPAVAATPVSKDDGLGHSTSAAAESAPSS